eukprot:TRINITY_DN916_c0_g1_i1.p1 TRINITY_DN916_c0_g1~~TRINITY_DN916_c0_g1_i1.p1  ORF type:complete len:380 (-),score=43.95 TRINITY_DN916_c0_g1_i1:209-1348(-)
MLMARQIPLGACAVSSQSSVQRSKATLSFFQHSFFSVQQHHSLEQRLVSLLSSSCAHLSANCLVSSKVTAEKGVSPRAILRLFSGRRESEVSKPTMEVKWWSKDTVAVVTGANKGIGFFIAKRLAKEGITTVLAARNEKNGLEAVKKLHAEGLDNVEYHCCDLLNHETIDDLARWLKEKYGGIDVLVNNAGFAYHGNTFGPEEAKVTIDTNYHGTKAVTERLLPLLRPSPMGARIVNVGSLAGLLKYLREDLQAKFTDPNLTVEGLDKLTDKFIEDIRKGVHSKEGWSNSMYSISKIAELTYTRLLAKELASRPEGQKVIVTVCCPGYCATDMSSWKGPKPADVGADTPVWLALTPPSDAHGQFYSDRRKTSYSSGGAI